jgi:hypothetical protein
MITRKWLFTIVAVLGAAGAVVSTEFGLTVKLGAVIAFIAAALVYVFNEAKADKYRITTQQGKWTDPKFVITLVSAVVAALAQQITLPVSPEIIITVLTVIVGILFKTKPTA